MKSRLFMTAAVLAAGGVVYPLHAEITQNSIQTPHLQSNTKLAQEKGGGMSRPDAAESRGGETAEPKKGMEKRTPEKGAQKGRMEKENGAMEKGAQDKGEKAEHRDKRDAKDDMKKDEKTTQKNGDSSREKPTRGQDKGDHNAEKGTKEKSSAKGTAKNVHLDDKQETRVKTVIKSQKVTHLSRTKINFSINVGRRVPASVHWYPLPVEIIELVPEYRGYYYIVVDEEVIIIEPETREIVTVIHIA